MLIDARDLDAEALLECDICIIGGGAAGITLAMELMGSRLQVCLIESGGLEYENETQALYKGEIVGHPYADLDACRLRFFGGTTNHWEGSCSPLQPIDFDVRPWVQYSGWPFSRREIEPYYAKAQAYCQLGPFNYDPEYWIDIDAVKPLALRPGVVSSRISQHSPPTHFGEQFLADLKRAADTTVILHGNLVEMMFSEDLKSLARMRCGVLGGGHFSVVARNYVLAMGGIENARMLLLSNSTHENRTGNQYDNVGRFFMDHPVVEGAIFQPSDPRLDLRFYDSRTVRGQPISAFLELSEATLRKLELTNVRLPFVPHSRLYASEGVASYHAILDDAGSGEMPEDFWAHLGNMIVDYDMIAEATSRKLLDEPLFDSANEFAYYGFDTMIEQTPNPSSRVVLSDDRDSFGLRRVKLDWRISDSDVQNLWRCYEVIGAELGQIGAGRVRLLRDQKQLVWGKYLSWGSHHMGTTRMHRNPRLGVVDPDCRLHGTNNLYLAGSSVFPTGGHVPPTLTIVALAIRLAETLRLIAAG